MKNLQVDSMFFRISYNQLICEYQNEQKAVFTAQDRVVTTLENMRQNRKDDVQAITAVHESGHTVLSIILLKTVPNSVYSITSDAESQGFVWTRFPWKYISRKELIPRVAMMLGGYVAEELIFGKENVTAGASSDIEKATAFLSDMFKNSGMGKTPIKYSIEINDESNNKTYHKIERVEEEIKNAIEEAKILAETTLKTEQKLLLSLSDYLSNHRMLRKSQILPFVEKYVAHPVNCIEKGDLLFYRAHLKKQVKRAFISKPPNVIDQEIKPATY